ncbi:MAG: hypothetical protein GY952_12515 [Rhodobacteraceae bacterium]|nr:hypothetical protein [Paracoccaceae bacterium]
MTDLIQRTHSTDADGPIGAGLRLMEQTMQMHVDPDTHGALGMGQKTETEGVQALRHWPDRVLLVSSSLPCPVKGVEISHGQSVLFLHGPGALRFLADYSSADLFAKPVSEAGTLRSRIGRFDLLFWWDDPQNVHIAVSRSYAQSFVDHLRLLASRRSSPVATDRPEDGHFQEQRDQRQSGTDPMPVT